MRISWHERRPNRRAMERASTSMSRIWDGRGQRCAPARAERYMTGRCYPVSARAWSRSPSVWRADVSRRHHDPTSSASQLQGRPRAGAGARSARAGDAEALHHRARIVDDTNCSRAAGMGRHPVFGPVGTTASRWPACRCRPRPSACRSPAISTCPRSVIANAVCMPGCHSTSRSDQDRDGADQIATPSPPACRAGRARRCRLRRRSELPHAPRTSLSAMRSGSRANHGRPAPQRIRQRAHRSVKVQAGAVRSMSWSARGSRTTGARLVARRIGRTVERPVAARRVQVAPTQRRSTSIPRNADRSGAEAAKERRFWLIAAGRHAAPGARPHVKALPVEQDYRNQAGVGWPSRRRGWRGFNQHVNLRLRLRSSRRAKPLPPSASRRVTRRRGTIHTPSPRTSPHRPHDHGN